MIGNQPSLTNNAVARTISVTATAGQTLFTVTGGYKINQLGVFRNGTKLVDALDYNARDGSTVTLLSPASDSDVLEFQIFDTFRVSDALDVNSGGTVNGAVTIVSAATTALLVDGNARVTGILTVGNSSITLDGTNNSINIGSVSIAETGITGGTSDIVTRNITGVAATFTGNVSIAGTLTYEDVTNIDSVGLITARSGVILTGGDITLGTGTTISAPTTNEFAVSTNGSERIRVDSSGNINVDSGGVYYDGANNRLGIGTMSPGRSLHVSGGSNSLVIERTDATTSALLCVAGNNQTEIYSRATNSSTTARDLAIHVGSSEALRVDTSGRLLVGTSSSSSNPSGSVTATGGFFSTEIVSQTINSGASISVTVPVRGVGVCYLVSVSRRQGTTDNYQGLYMVHYSGNSTPQAVITITALSGMTVSASTDQITLTNGLGYLTAATISATRIS